MEEHTDEQLCSHARTALNNVNIILKAIQERGIEFDISSPAVRSRTMGDRQTIYELKLTFKKEICDE